MSVSRKYWLIGLYFLISFPLFSQFSQDMYLEVNLNETSVNYPFAKIKPSLEIFRVIEKAANDNKIRGIVLNIGSFSDSRDFLWELRSALEQFKSGGKKICAFISGADIDTYCLASVADKIVMDELGTLSILGYSVGRGYVRHTLEKLGIGVRELRYLEYKSAAESYTRDSMSQADRRQYNDYLDDIFNHTRETLKIARNWTNAEFDAILNNEFIYSAKSAQSRGLVDYIGGRSAVLEAIREIEGASVIFFALYGDSESSLMGTKIPYAPSNAGGLFYKPPIIAFVNADGQTDMERGMSAINMSKIIRELADRSRVKAIVIRINSPGGSAQAADYFAEAVRYAKQKKPVVVTMGEVAASGGYWAAMYANHITATPYTITGSIGVIGSWFYDNGLNEKLGFSMETLKRGNHSDLLSGVLFPYRNLTAQEEERYKKYILDIYDIFVTKVSEGRGMEIDKVEASAQGRVFSGTRALNAGLIDSIGGIPDAIRTARALAEINDNVNVSYEEYPKPTFLEKVLESIPLSSVFSRNVKSRKKAAAQSAVQGAAILEELFLPGVDLRYRLENNGRILPILPLEFMIK